MYLKFLWFFNDLFIGDYFYNFENYRDSLPNGNGYNYGIQTLHNLKAMLLEVTKRNLSTSDLTLGIELLNDLNDKQNSEIFVKYLSDSKVINLPDDFQRKLDHGLLMISRMKTQSQYK